MKGAFQTSREIFEHPIWNDIPKFRIFFYIYGNAVFAKEGTTVAGMHLNRGQYLRSYRNLQEDLTYIENRSIKKYSLSVIKRKIDSLVQENRLKIEDTELGTLFTVVNYEMYQGFEHYGKQNLERSENSVGTQMEQSWNNNKNVNKDKNDKELISSSSEQEFSEVMKFYQENLQRGITESPYNHELISQWFDEFGSDVLLAAMKVATKAEAKGVNFTEGVLKKWREAGVKTIEEARQYEMKFKENKKPYKNNVVQIPNYGGDRNVNGKGNEQHSNQSRNVQLFK